MPWEVVFHVCQDKTYKAAEEQTCRQSPSITECHGFGECSGYLWHRRVKSDGFFDAHCRVWNFTEILPLEKNKAHKYWRMTKVTCFSSEDLNPPTSRNCLCHPKPAWPRPCISSGVLGCRPGSTWCTRGQLLRCRGLQTWKIPLLTVCQRQTGTADCHSTRRTKGKQSRIYRTENDFFLNGSRHNIWEDVGWTGSVFFIVPYKWLVPATPRPPHYPGKRV